MVVGGSVLNRFAVIMAGHRPLFVTKVVVAGMAVEIAEWCLCVYLW